MYVTKEDDSTYRVSYRSYRFAVILLLLPPLMIYELGADAIGGNADGGELLALALGVFLPLIAAYFLVELSGFSFSKQDDLFRWSWHNLLRRNSGEIPLQNIIQVRREAIDSGDAAGNRLSYRLVVDLDDGRSIGLTRGYSGFHDKKLELIVDDIREFLGHFHAPG